MILFLLFVAAVSADQITKYSIDYGAYKVPATMLEEGNTIVFTSSSNQARIDNVIVNYDTTPYTTGVARFKWTPTEEVTKKQVVLKSEGRQQCSVAEIDDVVKQKIEEYRQTIHEKQTLPALYFTFATRKPTDETAPQKQLVQDLCPGYNVDYVRFLSADTTPPRFRQICWGLSWGRKCYGFTGK